jgi:2-polyprenyl-3-methyl-5-hydroxy-6-metoxy-1,4-benzoquinol methylase
LSLSKKLSAPLRAYLNPRFEAIVTRLDRIVDRLDQMAPGVLPGGTAHNDAAQLAAQSRIDVSGVNARYAPAPFASLASQAVDSTHFDDEAFLEWMPFVTDGGMRYHRKPWEHAFVLERARRAGVLEPGRRALGFGVGTEPIPAVLASRGLTVVATDQAPQDAEHWAESGEHAVGVASLSRPGTIDDATLAERVEFVAVDMNHVPDDLGTFDLVWSSCALEHLGSPQAGLDFVLRSLESLEPGGIAVHTTELELTARDTTADHGHCAVYRPQDLEQLAREVTERGYEIELNLYVPMATPEDRFVALPPYPGTDAAHLKLQIFDSVSTSFGFAIRKPAAGT